MMKQKKLNKGSRSHNNVFIYKSLNWSKTTEKATARKDKELNKI